MFTEVKDFDKFMDKEDLTLEEVLDEPGLID